MVKTSELWSKEVINIVDGKRLGLIEDVELDLQVGKIEAVIIPGRGGLFGFFGGSNDLIIDWKEIEKIGEDVILVNIEDLTEDRYQANTSTA